MGKGYRPSEQALSMLWLVMNGTSYKTISDMYETSQCTVENRLGLLLEALGVDDLQSAFNVCYNEGWIPDVNSYE